MVIFGISRESYASPFARKAANSSAAALPRAPQPSLTGLARIKRESGVWEQFVREDSLASH
jgi:hypothetical protein